MDEEHETTKMTRSISKNGTIFDIKSILFVIKRKLNGKIW